MVLEDKEREERTDAGTALAGESEEGPAGMAEDEVAECVDEAWDVAGAVVGHVPPAHTVHHMESAESAPAERVPAAELHVQRP